MSSAVLALLRISRASHSLQASAIRLYLLRFIAQNGTRSQVAFADRNERDERGAQLVTRGAAVTLTTVRGAA